MEQILNKISWDGVIGGAGKLFKFGCGLVQRRLHTTVTEYLRSLLCIFISLLCVILLEWHTWKKKLRKNNVKEDTFTLYHQLFTTYDREDIYTAGILLVIVAFSTLTFFPSLIYGAAVLFSFFKCSITLFLPLIDLINILFHYQQIMILRYTEYSELIANGTSSVSEYSSVKPPGGLCISLLICLLRIALSMHIMKDKFKPSINTVPEMHTYASLLLEFMLLFLPYTSRTILGTIRRVLINVFIIKMRWALCDGEVQSWLLLKLVQQGQIFLINNGSLEKAFSWLFRGRQEIKNFTNSATIFSILFVRFVFTLITIFFVYSCIEEPPPDVIQFKLNTLKAQLVFFLTEPDTFISLLCLILVIVYSIDAMGHVKKAETHGNLAFVWFLTEKDLRSLLATPRNVYNRLRPGRNSSTQRNTNVLPEQLQTH